jgi:hypothetical protein
MIVSLTLFPFVTGSKLLVTLFMCVEPGKYVISGLFDPSISILMSLLEAFSPFIAPFLVLPPAGHQIAILPVLHFRLPMTRYLLGVSCESGFINCVGWYALTF